MAAEDLFPELDIGEVASSMGIAYKVTCKCDEDDVRKGRFVTVTAGENQMPLVHECDASERIFGVALKDGDTDDMIPVLKMGYVKMYAGGAFAAGDALMSDAEGRCIKALAASVSFSGAQAHMSAGEADDEILVFVCPSIEGVGT